MQKADLNNNIRRSHIELVTSEEKIKNLQAMKIDLETSFGGLNEENHRLIEEIKGKI